MAGIRTAPLVAAGLIGGFATARYTARRPLGGVVLGAAGAACTRQWRRSSGNSTAAALLGAYLAAFGTSHPLAKNIGAWPAVLAVTAAASAAAHVFGDRQNSPA